ncbi:hypothetical protein J6590_062226 [Homalodisca vitripennis]|nr:hypothetical protein J6590_062226 [Homalodisca vitripennis]
MPEIETCSSDDGESYLMRVLLSIDPGEEAFSKVDQALHLHTVLDAPISELVSEMDLNNLENYSKSQTIGLEEELPLLNRTCAPSRGTFKTALPLSTQQSIIQTQSKKQLLPAIASVLRILNDPETSIREGEMLDSEVGHVTDSLSHCLRSDLGLSTIVSSLDQIVNVRLSICRWILVLLRLCKWDTSETQLWMSAQRVARQLWAQRWLCQALSHIHGHLALTQFVFQEGITQHSILKSASTLAHYTWPGSPDECGRLAQFLLDTKEHLLVQELARLAPSKTCLIARAYLLGCHSVPGLLDSGKTRKS